jgi:hypothetical protein
MLPEGDLVGMALDHLAQSLSAGVEVAPGGVQGLVIEQGSSRCTRTKCSGGHAISPKVDSSEALAGWCRGRVAFPMPLVTKR